MQIPSATPCSLMHRLALDRVRDAQDLGRERACLVGLEIVRRRHEDEVLRLPSLWRLRKQARHPMWRWDFRRKRHAETADDEPREAFDARVAWVSAVLVDDLGRECEDGVYAVELAFAGVVHVGEIEVG